MDMTPGMEQTPAMGTEPGAAAQEAPQGYCIELHVLADGSYRVFTEPLNTPEEQDEAGKGKSFDSIGAALKEVLDIVKAGGEQENEEEDMNEGFGNEQAEQAKPLMPKGGYEGMM